LARWLPATGLVLEIASGSGEHAVAFAKRFPSLWWQPSDLDGNARASIGAWRATAGLANLAPPLAIDAAEPLWPIERAHAVLSINMVHISPWASSLGLLEGAARILYLGAPLILYGPWLSDSMATAPSNVEFDLDLKRRNPAWGLRRVEDFASAAAQRGFDLAEQQLMPANNLMLLFHRSSH
jgi:hypothetical protein